MKTYSNALILFAKVPKMLQVKTRLHPHLDHQTIYNLYRCFLKDSIEKLCATKNVDRLIGGYPAEQLCDFDDVAASYGLKIFPQEGENLGKRMESAFSHRFEEKYQKVVIIGSDSPSLPLAYIETAFRSDKDVVLGPSTDGGYYLVGMNGRITEIFDQVAWGSETVLAQTLDQVKKAGATLELLPLWYDVDTFESLQFLATHLKLLSYCGDSYLSFTKDFLARMDF